MLENIRESLMRKDFRDSLGTVREERYKEILTTREGLTSEQAPLLNIPTKNRSCAVALLLGDVVNRVLQNRKVLCTI